MEELTRLAAYTEEWRVQRSKRRSVGNATDLRYLLLDLLDDLHLLLRVQLANLPQRHRRLADQQVLAELRTTVMVGRDCDILRVQVFQRNVVEEELLQ